MIMMMNLTLLLNSFKGRQQFARMTAKMYKDFRKVSGNVRPVIARVNGAGY